jgi:hypothetical protein
MARFSPKLESRSWRLLVGIGPAAVGIGIGLRQALVWRSEGASRAAPWWSLFVASILIVVLVLALEAAGGSARSPNEVRAKYGWLSVVIGADGYLSTSKTQVMLWSFGFAFALAFLGMLVAFGAVGPDGKALTADTIFNGNDQWDKYLLLLGGPFAAGVLAKGIVVTKTTGGTLQTGAGAAASPAVKASSTSPPGPAPSATDVITNNTGDLDLVDTQYFLFNLVAILYVGAVFISNAGRGDFKLPDIPSTLLALTGLSAATYVANKAAQKSAPAISDVSPGPLTPRASLVISGVNFRPAGYTDADAMAATRVVISSNDASGSAENSITLAPGEVTALRVTATVPSGLAAGRAKLRVITAANVATSDFPVIVGS